MDIAKKLSFFIFALCVLISLRNQNSQITKYSRKYSAKIHSVKSRHHHPSPNPHNHHHHHDHHNHHNHHDRKELNRTTESKIDQTELYRAEKLRYDYYSESCPFAEEVVREAVREAYKDNADIAPALLRLFFHDCFIQGCDASVLLDPTDEAESEKQSPPNESLRGFDLIDTIKFKLEEACPGVVSCADIIVLAARESVVLSGGPFYPLHTGRRDSNASFPDVASVEIPSPNDDLPRAIELFAEKGFNERETVSLLGAHSIGMVHCKFFVNRLDNFRETGRADPTMDPDFLNVLRSKCSQSSASVPPSLPSQLPSPSSAASAPSPAASAPSPLILFNRPMQSALQNEEPAMKMDFEGPRTGFGSVYYRSLLQHKGLLYLDQQLTTGEETDTWVKAYASDVSLFRKDFTLTMIKLSNFKVLTGPMGQVRSNCREFKS